MPDQVIPSPKRKREGPRWPPISRIKVTLELPLTSASRSFQARGRLVVPLAHALTLSRFGLGKIGTGRHVSTYVEYFRQRQTRLEGERKLRNGYSSRKSRGKRRLTCSSRY